MDKLGLDILLVTSSSPQTHLLLSSISERLKCQVSVSSPKEALNNNEKTLVLLDANHVDEDIIRQWCSRVAEKDSTALAVFNVLDENHGAELLASLYCRGIFYRSDNLEVLYSGITKLLEGGFWMPSSLMMRLIETYRHQLLNIYRPACGLTPREMEIVGLLGSGSSNKVIADRLLITENTVKSHLHRIYRKLKVQNRIQAMNWARQNLSALPPTRRRLQAG